MDDHLVINITEKGGGGEERIPKTSPYFNEDCDKTFLEKNITSFI